jgi:ribose transport system ATP-binding protein
LAIKHDILLNVANVTKTFGVVRALTRVTFDVRAGEVHGLVGENGAGKSTLMAVASGALVATQGTVQIAGHDLRGDPQRARDLGLAIVRQEPALMPDLTVAENLFLGLPEAKRPRLADLNGWAANLMSRWSDDVAINVRDHVATLNPEQRFIVEIVKALSCEPKVLVLDEPTEHLVADDVARLFTRIRELTKLGTAVVYISHRIREVQQIADRLTVLRDGEGQGTYDAKSLSEDQIVALIVGEALDRTFPAKSPSLGDELLSVQDLTGPGFTDITFAVRAGEILGFAGIDGNGQREVMRALAGLAPSRGTVMISGKRADISSPPKTVRSGVSYLPGDRHREGIFADLTVRENFSARSPSADIVAGFVRRSSEDARAEQAVDQFAIKTPDIETPVRSLSGGNQQKLVLSSVLATKPKILLVNEPTQGVDVGARAEIYKTLREVAKSGVAVIVVSSDAQEVAGLSDRVAIFSRGHIVQMLAGAEVTEDNITGAVLKSTSHREKTHKKANALLSWAAGNSAPLVMVLSAILLLGAAVTYYNPFYISPRNLMGMAVLISTLAIVAYGQQVLLLVGGIDLSVGPLMGLCMVVSSFFLGQTAKPLDIATGWLMVFLVALAVGLANWILVDPLGLHPMVATLATFMALQAISLILRPVPDGMIANDIMRFLGTKWGYVPAAFVAAALLALVLEHTLYRRTIGLAFRGLGSRMEAARVAGISPVRSRLIAYVGCSLLTGLAAVTMVPQVGTGDPRAGLGYTLTSIAAAVIGGASLFGGRGSFIGCLLGATFLTEINTVTSFLGLEQAWQSYLLGALILAAVALYSKSRQLVVAART